jgi:hypothetical protein
MNPTELTAEMSEIKPQAPERPEVSDAFKIKHDPNRRIKKIHHQGCL